MRNLIKSLFAMIRRTYQENDPTTPELSEYLEIPEVDPTPQFQVIGDGVHADQVKDSMVFTLKIIQRLFDDPIKSWSSTGILTAFPLAGIDFNAYYDRHSLRFFYKEDPVTKQTIYTCESADVVSHELGHAILDALRPELWNVQAIEVAAFHEAFGDMVAVLTALSHDHVLSYVIKETDGDLSRSNVASRVGEQLGIALFHLLPNSGRSALSLRDVVNKFQYSDPNLLPGRGNDDVLLAEAHNFSRVFSGAWYGLLTAIYEATPGDRVGALATARDVAGSLLLRAIKTAPVAPKFFESVANEMIRYSSNPTYKVFFERKIVKDQLKSFAFSFVPNGSVINMRLIDDPMIQCQDFNPLYNFNVDIAIEHVKEFSGYGYDQAINAAKHYLDHIREFDMIGENKEFAIQDHKLVRNFFSCCRRRHDLV